MATIQLNPSLSARANVANLINSMNWSEGPFADLELRNDYTESDIAIITCRPIDRHPSIINPDGVSSGDSVLVVVFTDGKLIQFRYGRIILPTLFAKLGPPSEEYESTTLEESEVLSYVKGQYPLVNECVDYSVSVNDINNTATVTITPKAANENPIYVDGKDYSHEITVTAKAQPQPEEPDTREYTFHDLGEVVWASAPDPDASFPNPEKPPEMFLSSGIVPPTLEDE